MRRFLLLTMALLCLLSLHAPAFASPGWQEATATLTVLNGGVAVGSYASGARAGGFSGQTLHQGDRVSTDASGHALITFLDGSELEMFHDTEILLRSLGTTAGGGSLVQVEQALGTTLNRVLSLGDNSTYQLSTPNLTALVRGTIFEGGVDRTLDTGRLEEEYIRVIEGVVAVDVQSQRFSLQPGEQLVIHGTDQLPGEPPAGIEVISVGQVSIEASRTGLDPRIGMAEGWRSKQRLMESQAGTDRVLFSWVSLQPNGPDSFQPQFFEPSLEDLRQELAEGREVVGLIQFTPAWAARDLDRGERSVPRDLGDPNGPWYQFVRQLVDHYKGVVKHWMIWNDMDFRETDHGLGSWTWAGTEADYWQLLKDASRAAREVDPEAQSVFGATNYWVDENNGRTHYLQRVLDVAHDDHEMQLRATVRPSDDPSWVPGATQSNGWPFEVVAFNVYRAPDDIYRIYQEMRALLERNGVFKPLWLTEHNCMPFNDPQTSKPDDAERCTLDEQSAYTIQAYAMAFAAGWERALWYQLTDNNIWQDQEVWGLIRDDGSERPAFRSYRVVSQYFSHADRFTLRPLRRATQTWITWPEDPQSYYPNWQVYQVVIDRGLQRINVLWNASGEPLRVRVPRQGLAAALVNQYGERSELPDQGGYYEVELAPAAAHGPSDPDGYYYIGGAPLLVVQEGVPGDPPILEPTLVP